MKELFERVSIRKFELCAVEAEKMETILRAAMAAPSAGNQQPWEFVVVTNREKIAALSKSHRYAGCAANAPVVIVPCYRTEGLWAPEYAEIDLAIATENLLLAITGEGLGGVWLGIAPHKERMETVERILNLPKTLHAFALVPVGYPAEHRKQEDRFDPSRIRFVE